MKHLLFCVVLAVAADACGGGNKVTGPVPCDTYTGGVLTGNSGQLPGTYTLRSVCSGVKPDQTGASGSVTLTPPNFTASITSQGVTTTYNGTYTLTAPDGITRVPTSDKRWPATVPLTARLSLRRRYVPTN